MAVNPQPMPASTDIRPVPDPTVLTTQQLLTSIAAVREIIETRLEGMDKAIELLQEERNKARRLFGRMVDEKVNHLQDLHTEKFAGIANQFQERDTRSERESRDNKVAVDAAFAAQKEAAARQDESNQKAIDKSEAATAEKINKLAELFETTNEALRSNVGDLKDRLTLIEGRGVGQVKAEADTHQSSVMILAVVSGLVGLAALVVAIIVALRAH